MPEHLRIKRIFYSPREGIGRSGLDIRAKKHRHLVLCQFEHHSIDLVCGLVVTSEYVQVLKAEVETPVLE